VAITAVNPAPLLVAAAEHALIGKQADEHTAAVVGELAAKTAKPLTTSALTPEYRREMVRVFAKRAVLAAAKSTSLQN
jgi:carbon-monoxide dehydrogenase medium subunit